MKKLAIIAIIAIAGICSIVAKAGPVGGSLESVTSVDAHTTDRYSVYFNAGEIAQVFVKGDGDTDLDLYVYDENGNLIGKDIDSSDTCLVRFCPKWAGKFTIYVVNHGGVYNCYRISAN